MEWPAPLTPLITCGVTLKMQFLKQNPKNSQELWNVVYSSWAKKPILRCQKLVDLMRRRYAVVIKNNGYATKY